MSERTWTEAEAMSDALQQYPDCAYADWTTGLDAHFRPTIVVQLWRNEDCYLNDDPPRREVQGYLRGSWAA